MLRLAGWIATVIAMMFLFWQTIVEIPIWPRPLSALLLLLLGVLAGIRIGADSAAAYIKDLQRTNKVVVDQNRELQQANAMLLKEVSSELTSPTQHS